MIRPPAVDHIGHGALHQRAHLCGRNHALGAAALLVRRVLRCNIGSAVSLIQNLADENNAQQTAMWEAEWEHHILESAMGRVKDRLDPLKFQVFDFYVNRGWPPEKVARTFKVSVNQVYLAKNRVTEMLRAEARRLEQEVT